MDQLRTRRRCGFTLVELLVVIAIIGILIALLLPAVQAAREAARRTQCSNHLKQLGLAILNYESSFGVLPAGTQGHDTSSSNSDIKIDRRASWALSILPFLEQEAMFAKFNFNLASFADGQVYHIQVPAGTGPYVPACGAIAQRFAPAALVCPSNPMPRFNIGSHQILTNSYVAIAGSDVEGPCGNNPLRCRKNSFGAVAFNGALTVNAWHPLSALRDGTSNVMLLGEQSDWTLDYLGKQNTCRASGHSGHWAGTGWDGQTPPQHYVGHTHNITTITLPLGTRICPTPGTQNYAGENGTSNPNTPIRSAHPGGALVLFGDGSVHFLTEGIDTEMFKLLAIRDSGVVKQL